MILHEAANENTLIQLAKQGDFDAFTTLYQRYLPNVYKRVKYVIPEQDVEDVTQEVFIAVMKSLHNFRGEALFSTWLRTLTNRKIAEYYRKRNRRGEQLQAPLSDVEKSSQKSLHSRNSFEERIALRNGLNKLPEKYREIILLRFAEGMQFNEIAVILDLSLEATKSLFRRAIAALRKKLD